MSSSTILNLSARSPIDGTESLVLATTGANWKAALGTNTWVFGGVAGGTSASSTLTLESTTGTGTSDKIVFLTGSQLEALRIDTSGKVVIGGVAAQSFGTIGTVPFQVQGTGPISASAGLAEWSADANRALFSLAKSRGAAVGTHTAVVSADPLGTLSFKGSDGSSFISGASIEADVDGTVSAGVVPCRLVFSTANTSGTVTEAMRIDTGSNVVIASGGSAALAVGGNTAQLGNYGTTLADGGMALAMFNATAATAAHLDFYRSKNAALGSATVVASGDALGSLNFYGAQQTGTFATQNAAAQIIVEVDGTVTSGAGADMPGRLRFLTSADGSGTPTERMRIDSAGTVSIPGSSSLFNVTSAGAIAGATATLNTGAVATTSAPQLYLNGNNLVAIPASSNSSIGAGADGGLIWVRDQSTSGQAAFFTITGGTVVLLQGGAKWSVTTTPTASNYGVNWDGASAYKIYNGNTTTTVSFQVSVIKLS